LEDIDGEGFGGNEGNHAGITGFDEFGFFFQNLTSSSVDLGVDFVEFAGDVSGVAIEDWAVTLSDLSGVIEDDNLGQEVSGFSGWVVLGVRSDVTSFDIFDGDVFDIESDVVSGFGFGELFVVHFD